jgi:hypothetical protein
MDSVREASFIYSQRAYNIAVGSRDGCYPSITHQDCGTPSIRPIYITYCWVSRLTRGEPFMPTAVERLFDSFLKLDRREEALLDTAFQQIGSDFLKLSGANADNFLKIEHDHSLKIDFDVIGDAFLKISSDFSHGAVAASLLDQFVLKLSGNPESARGPQADFVALDHKIATSAMDLKILGTDFLKLDTARSVDALHLKIDGIGTDFLKLGDDMAADRDAFLTLGADFLKIGGDGNSRLDMDYKTFGGDLQSVGRQFDALATDFFKLGKAVEAGGGGGAGMGANASGGGGAGDIGTGFMTLFQDFHGLGTAVAELGDGSVRLLNDLLHQSLSGGGDGHGGHTS